jgi:Domain of unknown function (DUF1707)
MTGPEDQMAAGGRGRLRASHADREQVIELLKAAFVQDRLTKGEFDARVGQALASRTYAELTAATADLPAGPAAAPPPRPAREQAAPSGSTELKTAVRMIIATTVLTAGAWAGAWFIRGDDGAAFMLVFTFTFVWLGMLILTGMVMRESRHQKRSGRELPPRRTASSGGQASRHPAPADPTGPLPPGDHGHQHAAGAARSDLGDADPSTSRPPRRWDPRGRRNAIGYASN